MQIKFAFIFLKGQRLFTQLVAGIVKTVCLRRPAFLTVPDPCQISRAPRMEKSPLRAVQSRHPNHEGMVCTHCTRL